MKGMELTAAYWEQTARPALERDFPGLFPRLAAGLAGNGSECFGYDDDLSRDHDWGVDFFLWVTPEDRDAIPALQAWKRALLETCPPAARRERSRYGGQVDVMTGEDFYRSLIGCPGVPRTLEEWRRAPEELFSLATNGRVFHDGPGAFTAVRRGLLAYYPEDLRRKKLAARCMALAQLGQYNFTRTVQRGDLVTARIILADFSREAMGLAFHLARVYRPYYKWTRRKLEELAPLGPWLGERLDDLARTDCLTGTEQRACAGKMEAVCSLLAEELRRQGLTRCREDFLALHGEELQRSIEDDFLRSLPVQME